MELTFNYSDAESYRQFIAAKGSQASGDGLRAIDLPDFLFDFQKHLVEWALRNGRSAILADCGLGKTAMQLAWADAIVRHTSRPVMLVTPLAVGPQTASEADKFGIDCERSRDGSISGSSRIVITNYEQLQKFDRNQFSGMVCDESSAIKSFKSERKKVVTDLMKGMRYRLLCTATAAPNDYWELGTSSEALGQMGYRDMLTMFFKQDVVKDYLGWGRTKYRFRGHAEVPFWRWVSSWARAMRKPSDLGFSDEGFDLPPLNEHEIIVETKVARDGMLFAMPGTNLQEQRQERRNSIKERCEMAASKAMEHDGPTVLWCELNDEADQLQSSIDGAKQVKGSMPDDQKEELLTAFSRGEIRHLVTKPKIGCWGLNWQHCSNVVMFPSHSFEQYYQAVRRCWRFGQKAPVDVHVIVNEGECGVLKNIRRKAAQADKMFNSLCEHMRDAIDIDSLDRFNQTEVLPKWL